MKALAVFSIKGGVGKSTIAVNLAYAAASQSGRRTLLWDLDAQGAATYLLNATPKKGQKGRALLAGEKAIGELVQETNYTNLDLLPADKSLRHLVGDLAQEEGLKQLKRQLKALETRYDRVIFDCPPGLSELSDRVFKAVDLIITPVIPGPLGQRTVSDLQAELQRRYGEKRPVFPVWNLVDKRRKLHAEAIAAEPDWPVIAYLAEIETMAVKQAPLMAGNARSAASRSFTNLWARIERQLLAE